MNCPQCEKENWAHYAKCQYCGFPLLSETFSDHVSLPEMKRRRMERKIILVALVIFCPIMLYFILTNNRAEHNYNQTVAALGRPQEKKLTAAEAKDHIGKKATVCGTVASANFAQRSRRQPTFLNFSKVTGASRHTTPLPAIDRVFCAIFVQNAHAVLDKPPQ